MRFTFFIESSSSDVKDSRKTLSLDDNLGINKLSKTKFVNSEALNLWYFGNDYMILSLSEVVMADNGLVISRVSCTIYSSLIIGRSTLIIGSILLGGKLGLYHSQKPYKV